MLALLSQPFNKPQLPKADFSGKTILVTGANVGLGKEAVKHFVNMGATRVIGTARSASKCASALADVQASVGRPGAVEFWELELDSYDLVKKFSEKASKLDRLDAAVLNASIANLTYSQIEDNEACITVNVISTILLALNLLPVLRRSAEKHKTMSTLSIIASEVHALAKFPERDAENIFEALNDANTKNMAERYPTSKLLQVLLIRELANRTASSSPFVVINTVNPGFNKTQLGRSATGIVAIYMGIMKAAVGWEPAVGARTLVHATVAGKESHGVITSSCKVENNILAPWIPTDAGQKIQRKVWAETEKKLEAIQPGVMAKI